MSLADATALSTCDDAQGASFAVRVQPRAAREGLRGVREGALVVHLNSPPVDGAANEALVRLLSRCLRVAPSSVTILRGLRGRQKTVRVSGMTAAQLVNVLSALVSEERRSA